MEDEMTIGFIPPPAHPLTHSPARLWLGLGFRRGTVRSALEQAIASVCELHQISLGAIVGVATIESKAGDLALLELCDDRGWVLQTFAAKRLADLTETLAAKVSRSAVVAAQVGTPSVAEAAAVLAAQTATATKSPIELWVPKTIVRRPDPDPAVTIAIAAILPQPNSHP